MTGGYGKSGRYLLSVAGWEKDVSGMRGAGGCILWTSKDVKSIGSDRRMEVQAGLILTIWLAVWRCAGLEMET